jgi:hypothetical protein
MTKFPGLLAFPIVVAAQAALHDGDREFFFVTSGRLGIHNNGFLGSVTRSCKKIPTLHEVEIA